ncbi:MAG: cupin domain-containing protein, partial [Planctomycetota bacterium]
MSPEATIPVLRWRDASWIRPGALFNVDHIFYPPGYVFMQHEHDYAEFSFVDHGRGSNHLGEAREPLRDGDLVFTRPDCRHAFAADAGGSLQFLNCAIPGPLYRDLEGRYGPD